MRLAMQRARAAVFVAIAAVSLGGCGTILNFATGDPDIYGGVQKDINFMQTPRQNGSVVGSTTGGGKYPGGLVMFGAVGADACLSLIADTLTLPIAVWMRQ